MYASMQGNISLVKLLLDHNSELTTVDTAGWTAIEHAAYRGHMEIVALLDAQTQVQAGHLGGNEKLKTATVVQTDRTSESHIPWASQPESQPGTNVWIRLGTNDAFKMIRPLELESLRGLDHLSRLEDESMYSISVCAEEQPTAVYEATLPLLGSNVNKPWLFRTSSIGDMRLRWQLYRQTSSKPDERPLVGSGLVMMGTLNAGLRPLRESLVRDTTVPLQDPRSCEFIGTVTFSFFWATPHPPPSPLKEAHFWEFGKGIGGHRGSGKNMIDKKSLQIGENTPQSFMTAIEHGASFIEFDIQLTKDLVPVVYHDFLLSEAGADATMQSLSYEQFEYLNRSQDTSRKGRNRSRSLQSADAGELEVFRERMSHSYHNKVNGFKSNTRGDFIHERSCTLEELFQQMPKTVRLNIELKYPMLFETDEWDMELIAIRADLFVNTVLDKVYEHAAGRTIVFSSFSPEICIALSTKQRSWPVFFLSKTSAPLGEVRSTCLQQAIHMAKAWGLPGIVADCNPFVKCPRLIGYVQSAGLACTSFGVGNSEPAFVKTQFDGGINAVISDSIMAIRQLRELAKEESDSSDPVRVFP